MHSERLKLRFLRYPDPLTLVSRLSLLFPLRCRTAEPDLGLSEKHAEWAPEHLLDGAAAGAK